MSAPKRSPASPARSRSNDPEGMRNRILDAAFEAFVTRGYHATAMNDIRDLAGVSGGAFAHHFPSKKQLGLAVLKERVADAVMQSWIAPVQQAATAKEGIRAVMTAIMMNCQPGPKSPVARLTILRTNFRAEIGIFRWPVRRFLIAGKRGLRRPCCVTAGCMRRRRQGGLPGLSSHPIPGRWQWPKADRILARFAIAGRCSTG